MKKIYFSIIFLGICAFQSFGQKSSNPNKFAYVGSVPVDSSYNDKTFFDCYREHTNLEGVRISEQNKNVILGLKTFSIGTQENPNNFGSIEFKYYIVLKQQELGYIVTAIKHKSSNPEYPEIGKFPRAYTEEVQNVFSEEEFSLIIREIDNAVKDWLTFLKKDLEQCY